ncbi:MAG: amidoligase family protein [Deltaproteobacteria bacterium]|jgi:hypothetical protein|nr:amidoligase family protein [Deltaproteobacteria bacterium]
MEGSAELEARLKKKYPMLRCFTDRPFGVEIEFYGLDYYILPPDNGIIKPYNIHSKATDGRSFLQLLDDYRLHLGADRKSWHLEEDGSIVHRGGVELISPVLRGCDGLLELYRYFQVLGHIFGVQIDASCGFHVHHGVYPSQYNCMCLKMLIKIVYSMEDYIYLLIAGDRSQKDTCRPMDLDVDAILKLGDCEDICKNTGCKLKELWYSKINGYDQRRDMSDRYNFTRYHGLNLHSYWYRSTIEFRYHSAILHQIDEAMQWIIFTQLLVELSGGSIPKIDYLSNSNKWMKAIYKIYLAFGYMNHINNLR